MRFSVVYTNPETGVVLLASPIDAPTYRAAEAKAKAWLRERPSLSHWTVTVTRLGKRDGRA